MQREESISLYFQAGSSDKRYDAFLQQSGGGWVVNFSYGRRGSTLRPGTKTNAPVDYTTAKKIYDKLVGSKTSEGYSPAEDATPFQATDKADRVSGLVPQLLNPIDRDRLADLMNDDDWIMQEKHDGERRLLKRTSAEIAGINRKGLTVAVTKLLESAALSLNHDFVVDGEAIGDRLFVFDILQLGAKDLTSLGYEQRLSALEVLVGESDGAIVTVKCAKTLDEKQALYEALVDANKEGVVFKRRNAPYVPGRPASGGDQVKFKFCETASALVAKVNAKRSVALSLFENGVEVSVGNVTIPANYEIPAAGDVVEVQYLYAYKGGSLYQPVYLGKRSDIDAAECLVSQLKFKPE